MCSCSSFASSVQGRRGRRRRRRNLEKRDGQRKFPKTAGRGRVFPLSRVSSLEVRRADRAGVINSSVGQHGARSVAGTAAYGESSRTISVCPLPRAGASAGERRWMLPAALPPPNPASSAHAPGKATQARAQATQGSRASRLYTTPMNADISCPPTGPPSPPA